MQASSFWRRFIETVDSDDLADLRHKAAARQRQRDHRYAHRPSLDDYGA
jgi:hypothetical protein